MMARLEAERAVKHAEEALLQRVAPSMRKRARAIRNEMLNVGHQPEEADALLVAMFVSQDPHSLEEGWRVLDPLGKGSLTLREFRSAFLLCVGRPSNTRHPLAAATPARLHVSRPARGPPRLGDAVDLEDLEREFKLVDCDGSGFIEIREFGGLLRRLSLLARGAQTRELRSEASQVLP